MQAIWKFPLQVDDRTVVRMPLDARILCVQTQNEAPMLWALVADIEGPTFLRYFRTYGTGHQNEQIKGDYIGTYQLHDGSLVFHVFEEKP